MLYTLSVNAEIRGVLKFQSLYILQEAMGCATDFLKHLCKWVLENCPSDMKFILKRVDQSIVPRLQTVVSSYFEKIPYCKAIDVLKQAKEKKQDSNIEWGVPLTEEHERCYLFS